MAPITLKYVVSFSSQDEKHPVENLLHSDVLKKWLCSPGEKTGKMEAEFQMEKASTISHLDIGAFFVFSIEIQVGRSSWPSGKEYVTLLPSSIFTSPADCRLERNKTVVRMFKKEDFDASASKEKWDRIRILCSQPFRKEVQFGLSLFKVVSDDENVPSDVASVRSFDDASSLFSSPPSRTGPSKSSGSSPSLSSSKSKTSFSPFNRTPSESSSSSKSLNLLSPKSQFSRGGQLLMAATGRAVQYKQPSSSFPTVSSETPPKEIESGARVKKKAKTIEDDINDFVSSIDLAKIDVETVTFADLRHQFEKSKFRKLSKEERKCFVTATLKVVEKFALGLDGKLPKNEVSVCNRSKSSSDKKFVQPLIDKREDRLLTDKNFGKNRASDNRQDTLGIGNSMTNRQKNDLVSQTRVNSFGETQNSPSGQKVPSKRKLTLSGGDDRFAAPGPKIGKKSPLSQSGGTTSASVTSDDVWLSKSSPVRTVFHGGSKTRRNEPSSTVTSDSARDDFPVFDVDDVDDDDLLTALESDGNFGYKVEGVECPLCMKRFPPHLIAAHASDCSL